MAAFLIIILFFIISCEPNKLEVIDVWENSAPKEAYNVSPEGDVEAYYSWYRNGIKAEDIPFKNNVPNGIYRKWSITGFIMETGAYKDSLREGEWTFFAKEKIPFMKGSYKKGLKHGKWILYNDKKIIAEQYYRNDSAIGIWKKYYNNIVTEENSCFASNKKGYFKSFSNEGKASIYQECSYGKPDGVFMSYYAGGSLHKIGHFANNLRNGLWVEYFATKKLKKVEHYVSSIRNGEWISFDESGKLISKTEFIDGTGVFEDTSWQNNRIHGELKLNFNNGEYSRIEVWKNGQKQSSTDYHKNATKPIAFGFWQNNKREGAWRNWYKNGILKDSLNFKNGELFGEQFHYDSTGRLYKKEKILGKNFPPVIEMLK